MPGRSREDRLKPDDYQTPDGRWWRRAAEPACEITDLKQAEERALKAAEEAQRFLAHRDELTSLPNRRLLDDRIRQAVYLAQRRDGKVAVLLIDLDEFRKVNESLGHAAGDALLCEVARRLGTCVRKADTLGRAGGDQFLLVIPDLASEPDCEVVAAKLLQAFAQPFELKEGAVRLGASIGISIFPGDAADIDALLRNADAALYRAKQLGRNQYRFYAR